MALPHDLPICDLRERFRDAFAEGPVVLTAPPGSGKSTWVPVWASGLGERDRGRALVVQPRRVACRSLTRFVARCLNVEVGPEVGYAVRHDDRLASDARIGYVTPGVALRMIESPLDARTAVLLDEFHERTLELDLLLAVLMARGHQRLGVLSATLEAQRLADHLGATWLQAPGHVYPVDVYHIGDNTIPQARRIPERLAAALDELKTLTPRTARGAGPAGADPAADEGDVLVFLPGKGEIVACQQHLQGRPGFDVLPLHGQLEPREQDRVFALSTTRRIILTTNVAETSVTIPGVRTVIDFGLVRRTTYREGRAALTLMPIAQDSATQRAGRAGRVSPGRCLRLWSAAGRLEKTTPPEIHREELSPLVVAACRLGHDVARLPFFDPPKDYAVEESLRLLGTLGLIDHRQQLTTVGVEASRLPLDPALARLLLAGIERDLAPEMICLVATLAVGGPFFAPGEPRRPEDGSHDALTVNDCDVTARILAMAHWRKHQQRLRGDALAEARRISDQLTRLLGLGPATPRLPLSRQRLARGVLAAYPEAAFARRPTRDAWGNGRVEVRLAPECLVPEKARTILVVDQHLQAELGRRVRRTATCCMPVGLRLLKELGVGETIATEPSIKDGILWAHQEWRLGTTVLERTEAIPQGDAAVAALRKVLLAGRHFPEAMAAARREITAYNLSQALQGGSAPQVSLETWLDERLAKLGLSTGAELPLVDPDDLAPGLLAPDELARIERRFPGELSVGDQQVTATYDPRRHLVTLTGKHPKPPQAALLPPWPGWRVVYTDGKRTLTVRE